MTTTIKRTRGIALVMALAILAMSATAAQALAAHFDGRILSKDAQTKTFRANTEQAGKVRFHTNSGTDYERIAGFGGLERGMKVEITAKRVNGHWLATVVERRNNNSGRG